jgi:hypothetical protein
MTKSKIVRDAHVAAAGSSTSATFAARKAAFDADRSSRIALGAPVVQRFSITTAYVLVRRALPRLRALRDTIAKSLPEFDLQHIDRIEERALSALWARSCERATQPGRVVDRAALESEAEALYQTMFATVVLLASRGLVPQSLVDEVRSGTGTRDRASDLEVLGLALISREKEIEGKHVLTREELNRSLVLSQELLDAMGDRVVVALPRVEATRERRLAAMLLAQSWDEIRRALTYVLWHEGTANDVAPSFNTGGHSGSAKGDDSSDDADRENDAEPDQKSDEKSDEKTVGKTDEKTDEKPAVNKARPLVPQDDPFVR